jgi:hypothetical protein
MQSDAGDPKAQRLGAASLVMRTLRSRRAELVFRGAFLALILYRGFVHFLTDEDWYDSPWASVWLGVFGFWLAFGERLWPSTDVERPIGDIGARDKGAETP